MKLLREIVTGRPVVALRAETSALDASRAMRDNHVGAVLVTDHRGAAVGIFTERDLMVRLVVPGRDPSRTPIGDLMTRDLYMATPEDRVSAAAQEMQDRHIRHLPVVEGERVIGLLSLRDLLREHLAVATSEVQALTAYIQHPGGEAEDRAAH